jgi:hypothetical protein
MEFLLTAMIAAQGHGNAECAVLPLQIPCIHVTQHRMRSRNQGKPLPSAPLTVFLCKKMYLR